MVEHLVVLRLRPGVAEEEAEALIGELRALSGEIPGVMDLQCGRNFSPARAHGYDIGLRVRFPGKSELAAYGPHPAHQRVLERIGQLCVDVLAIDFEV